MSTSSAESPLRPPEHTVGIRPFRDGLSRFESAPPPSPEDARILNSVNVFSDVPPALKEAEERNRPRFGYLSPTGNVVIPPTFAGAGNFSQGLAAVSLNASASMFFPNKAATWGYIDVTGRLVIGHQFNRAGRFREGLARVRTGGRWGFIDMTGRMVIPARFESAEDFRDGVALVEAPSSTRNDWGAFSKPVFINRTGKPIVEAGLPTWLKCGSAPEDLGRF